MSSGFVRALLIVHRYLGIAVGFLMVTWCLSGLVMMYVPYPQLAEDQCVDHLAAIDWTGCCVFTASVASDTVDIVKVQTEMLGGHALARITTQAAPTEAD